MEIQKIIKEFREQLESLYGPRLKQVILYGSWAREQATQDSDIDLAVILRGEVAAGEEIDRLIDIVTNINLNYGVLLSVYPVSENDYETIKSPILMNIHAEGIPA